MLFSKLSTATATLASLLPSFAAAAAIQSRTNGPLFVDNNFETVMNGDPIAATNQIGVYNLLYWTMNLVTPGVGNINPSGIIPHTRPNVAAFAANTVAINGPAMISANYQTSQIKDFTLTTGYFACSVASEETIASTPASCTMTATPFDRNNKQIGTPQTFSFQRSGAAVQNMNPITFNSNFQNVFYVTFAVSNPLVTAALLDDVGTILNEY